MSDTKIMINFGELKGFEAPSGDGPAADLPFDGYVQARLKKFTCGKAKSGNDKVDLVFTLAEDDVKGTLYSTIAVSGSYTNRAGETRPNLDQLASLLLSSGQTFADIEAAIKAGTTRGLDEILQDLVKNNAVLHLSVAAEVYQNRARTRVKGYVTPAFFAEQKAAGAHRKPRAAAGAASISNNGATKSVSGTASGADPLASVL